MSAQRRPVSHRAKQARQSSEEPIFNSARTPILLRDPQDRITHWNNSANDLYGFSSSEAVGRVSHDLLQTVFPVALRRIMQQIHDGRPWHGQLNHRRKDGERIPVLSQWIPHLDEDQSLQATLEVNTPIRDRDLQENLARLAAIVESSHDAIIGKTIKGIVTTWNPAAERMFGYSAQEMIGQPITRIIPPDRLADETHIIAKINLGQRVEHFETLRLTKDHRLVPVSLTISPIRDQQGNIIGVSKIARELTQQKNLNDAVTQRTAALETFTHGIAHDIRTRVKTIVAYTQTTLEQNTDSLDTESKSLLNHAVCAAESVNELLDGMLNLCRTEKATVRYQRLDPAPIIREIIQHVVEFQHPKAEILITPPLHHVVADKAAFTQ